MAEVRLPADYYKTFTPPAICAHCAQLATKTRKYEIRYTPPWAYFCGLIVAQLVGRQVKGKVAYCSRDVWRRRLAITVIWTCIFVFPVAGAVLLAEPGVVAAILTALSIAAFVWAARLLRQINVGGKWVDEHSVVITRLHPAYAAAVSEQFATEARRVGYVPPDAVGMQFVPPPSAYSPAPATVPAGWHADPSGRFDHRYWDGTAWTEHTSGPKDAPPA